MDNLNPAPFLSVRNLKTYFYQDEGTTKAVDGVSFDVRLRQTLGIVGESGCGKTVTALSILRILDRAARIVDGEITLRQRAPEGGADIQTDLVSLAPNSLEMRAIRGREIGLVFQEPMTSFSPVHTIGSQIVEAIRLHENISPRQGRERVLDLLAQVGIPRPDRCFDQFAFELSGGLRQRAMIAMALSGNPRLLIADEPTTALDVTTQAQILNLLQRLQTQHGMAIMLITHNLGVIAEMTKDVAVMYLGKIVEAGPVKEIFRAPKHPYTQALLRSIPSIHAKPRHLLPMIAGSIPHPFNRPAGCPFHPRCPDFIPNVCDGQEPRPVEINQSHSVSCFLHQ